MAASHATGVTGVNAHTAPDARPCEWSKVARVELSSDNEGFVDSLIAGAKRHPLTAVLVGLAAGLTALAITDRLTRKW